MNGRVWILCAALWLAGGVHAAERLLAEADAARVLQRIARAPQQVSFNGVYVQQYGEALETIHVCHLIEGRVVNERRDSLDGPPREMVRKGRQISVYGQDGMAFEPQAGARLFPSLLPEDPAVVLANYQVLARGRERVVGLEAEVYDLVPRDALRFPHRLWAHHGSGLLLKASTYSPAQEQYDLFAFSQLQIGGRIERALLKPAYPVKRVPTAQPDAATPAWARWDAQALPAGFRLVRQKMRPLPHREQAALHQIYSDGLVSISVFVEPLRAGLTDSSGRQGALNIHSRQVGQVQVTAVGEVPMATLELLARAYR